MRAAEFGAFLVGAFLVLATPGPSALFAVTRTLEWGRGAGLLTMVGLEVGLALHVLGAVLGLAALVGSSPALLRLVRLVGAGYLLLLAVRALRSPAPSGHATSKAPLLPTRWALLRAAFIVDLLNPSSGLFFLAFLPQFVRPDHGDPSVQLLVLGACTVVLAALCDSCWVLVTAATRRCTSRGHERPAVLSRRLAWMSSSAYVGIALLTVTG